MTTPQSCSRETWADPTGLGLSASTSDPVKGPRVRETVHLCHQLISLGTMSSGGICVVRHGRISSFFFFKAGWYLQCVINKCMHLCVCSSLASVLWDLPSPSSCSACRCQAPLPTFIFNSTQPEEPEVEHGTGKGGENLGNSAASPLQEALSPRSQSWHGFSTSTPWRVRRLMPWKAPPFLTGPSSSLSALANSFQYLTLLCS